MIIIIIVRDEDVINFFVALEMWSAIRAGITIIT